MGEKLDYRLSYYESDLRRAIADGFPDLDVSEIGDCVTQAINQIKAEGNSALTYGLTLHGRNLVREIIEKEQEGKLENRGMIKEEQEEKLEKETKESRWMGSLDYGLSYG